MISRDRVLGFIMAGGRGKRLKVLTITRCKPVVNILGRYRIFDFVATNIADTGIRNSIVAAQFQSESLKNYIGDGKTWGFDGINKNIEVIEPDKEGLAFEGTADSVRKSISRIDRYNPEVILILGSDHIYKIDYSDAIKYHIAKEADITIMTSLIPEKNVSEFGLIKIDGSGRIIDFAEKPTDKEIIESFRLTPEIKEYLGIENTNFNFLASMGNYIFFRERLKRFLDYPGVDFGKDIIPAIKKNSRDIYAYIFNGYWRDVGNIQDYFECNMEFINGKSPIINLEKQIKTKGKKNHSPIKNAILNSDNIIRESSIIKNSVLGSKITIEDQCLLENCIILGNDINNRNGHYANQIGKGSKLSHVILDENVWVGKDVNINPCNGTYEQRKKTLESVGLKPYRENGSEITKGDFYIEPDSGILIIGRQCETKTKKIVLPDGIRC
ncbi:hypothetical protein GF312_09135 [Candidatus Poribacteria bacterium]|nr:hypothetical protein [Candidatus Poribacteria bacterium]